VHDADLCAYIDQRQKEHYGEAQLLHLARQPDHRIRQRRHVRWSTATQQVYKQTILFQFQILLRGIHSNQMPYYAIL